MEGLAAYDSNSDEEDNDIDPEKSHEVIATLKNKFPLDSAPAVPLRVSFN